MNRHAPPKETGALLHAPKAELLLVYCRPGFLQAVGNRRARQRRCVSCGRFVGNSNLGGHARPSALSDPLWCYDCADYPRQHALDFGRRD